MSEFPFLGKFGSKNSKLFVLPKHLHKEYLEDADSYSDISFPNFQPEFLFLGKFGLVYFWKFRNFKIFKNHEGDLSQKLHEPKMCLLVNHTITLHRN